MRSLSEPRRKVQLANIIQLPKEELKLATTQSGSEAGGVHPLNPSAFVAVRDWAVEADGAPIEHWIYVPPHMATARETVAWTFGMSEHEYRPMRET